MQAAKYDFKIEQGSSFKLSLTHKDNDGTIVDISDYCARLTWKTNSGSTQVFSTENTDYSLYKFTIDGPNGKMTLLIPAEVTNEYLFNSAKYDLELQIPQDLYSGGGKYITRLMYGTITIIKRFSQSTSLLDCQI